MYPPILGTNGGDLATSLAALRRFCCTTPEIERFSIRKASNNDLEKIQGLLVHLTPRASGDFPTVIPEQTIVLVASDAFTQARDLVGTIALQTRKGLRPLKDQGSAHLHDFVVHPHYRHSGIGSALLTCALSEAHSHGISKKTLDCDKSCTSFYESFGFQPAAVHMVMYADAPQYFDKNLIQNQGEWMYGTLIAESLKAFVGNIKIPKYFFLPLESDPGQVSDGLSLQGKGFAVKYSLRQGDFSGNGRRGANSSRGRTLVPSSNSTLETVKKLEAFLKQAPENCAGLVLQELVDQTDGCLFHVELGDQTVVEMLWESDVSTGRALSEYCTKDQKLLFHEEPLDRLKGGREIANRCQHIFAKTLKNYGNICWSIEGFWKPVDQTLTILQLRPTPPDRPESPFKHLEKIVHQTGFSWGCFDVGPLDLRQPNTSVFIRNDEKATELEVTLLDRLRGGEKTLLIDTERGFTLSHERWFLPPPSLRENFGFIYIPQNTLNQLSQKLVRIVSSGLKGYVVDFN
jgi:N-acetylglutamate synthase-like GNAT family acetyltransferase